MTRFYFLVAFFLFSTAAKAQTDGDLGTVSAAPLVFAGSTVGASNNIDTYSTVNDAVIYDQDIIYRFAVASPGVLTLFSSDPDGISVGSPDMDFFLLSSLATTTNRNGLRAAQAIEADTADRLVTVSGLWNLPAAGTYFLAIDAFRGNPLDPNTPASGRAGAFSGTLSFAATAVPEANAALLLCVGAFAGLVGAMRRERRRKIR